MEPQQHLKKAFVGYYARIPEETSQGVYGGTFVVICAGLFQKQRSFMKKSVAKIS